MGGVFLVITTLFRTLFLLLAGASITVITVTRMAEANQYPFDPFAPYTDMMLGQSGDGIEARGFKCISYLVTSSSYMHQCSMPLINGIILKISLDLSPHTNHVTRLAFTLREKPRLGYLIILWGKPEINMVGELAYFYWTQRHITATAQIRNHHISYWLPITSVAFRSTE